MSKKQREEQAKKAKDDEERQSRLRKEKREEEDKARLRRARESEEEMRPPRQHIQEHQHHHHRHYPTSAGGPSSSRGAQPPPSVPRHDGHHHRHHHTHHPIAASQPLSAPSSSSSTAIPTPTLTEAEQELIRSKYLGIAQKHEKRTRRQLNDKKTMFGHDNEVEDTTDLSNPVLRQIVPVRGLRAGGTQEGESSAAESGIRRTNSKLLQTFSTPAHWSSKSLAQMQERDWRIFREDFGIAARGGHIPHPLRSWAESSIPASILECIEQIGYKEPSPIQRQAIPIGLKERDLIGIAETGSGKTASFVIPMLSYITRLPRMDESNKHLGPYALILAPTRELAQQIQVETQRFTSYLGFNCISIVGGRDMNEQALEAAKGAEIVIATPGRLKDCIDRHVVVLGQCAYVVMDEADRMVNLGFEEVLNYILDSLPVSNEKPDSAVAERPTIAEKEEEEEGHNGGGGGALGVGVAGEGGKRYRVTMLYSATMPASVERMARKYLRRPATITIGDLNAAVGTVVQSVEFVTGGEDKKKQRLLSILGAGFEPPVIVFSTTRQSVDMLSRELSRAGYPCATLHAGKSQEQREEALASLRSGHAPILVATDLAGRGIDVPDVSLVVNFSMPTAFEAYIHRIGRTGRAGKRGHAVTLLENGVDDEWLYDLKMELGRSPVSTVPRELERHPAAQARGGKRRRDDE
ncbi:P-loop containing nucleoside triphosphate hydrolase protein [Jaminaea rosea]|uniref:RNA helicase n=1 Tax=Jaminaea rosea TaxID=1569628 RepID=A0A316UKE9_9BASI|nr:P-loop containing nucleoside triphosphate hydrolase protein [Jaminaea rosea]PWN25700.1 P-loop containing nucleoside triphosphate hydrolase protein [Jaminaea rosea]